MNSEQRLKIQWNFTNLVDGLLVDEIADNLYTESVIEHDDLQRVNAEKTDRDKASCLINILITSENSFEPFLKEVESSRPDLAEKLKQTDVEEELRKGTHIFDVYMYIELTHSHYHYCIKCLLLFSLKLRDLLPIVVMLCCILIYAPSLPSNRVI